MDTPETGWYQGEGGTIIQMDLPLPEGIQQRVDRGEIRCVPDPDDSRTEMIHGLATPLPKRGRKPAVGKT